MAVETANSTIVISQNKLDMFKLSKNLMTCF